jgi:hypothetical protein
MKHTVMKCSTLSLFSVLVASMVTGCMTAPEGPSPDENTLPAEVPAETVSATTQSILGSDACKNTDITVTNSRFRNGEETILKVHYVEYHSVSEGKWYTEQLDDKVLFYGDPYTWWNQNLEHAENDLIDEWKVVYEYFQDGDWSPSLVYQAFSTPGHICRADDNFSFTVE